MRHDLSTFTDLPTVCVPRTQPEGTASTNRTSAPGRGSSRTSNEITLDFVNLDINGPVSLSPIQIPVLLTRLL